MVLRPEQFTEKALAVIQKSQEILAECMHTQWDPEHLLLAMLDEKGGVAYDLFDGLGVSIESFKSSVKQILESVPVANRPVAQVYMTPRIAAVMEIAKKEAERLNERKQNAILVRLDTSPEDINGMHAANGILTARGGMTSHAAVVARGMGKPCVSGSNEIKIDYENKLFKSNEYIIKEGDIITIDGGSGKVMLGEVPTIKPDISGDFSKFICPTH